MSKNEDRHQVYGIPRNLKSAGKIADTIEITSLVQSIIIAFVLLILFLKVFHVSYKFTFFAIGVVILFTILPYGKNSDSFCKYIYLLLRNFFIRKTYRRYVQHRSFQQKKTIRQRIRREQLQDQDSDIDSDGIEGGKVD